MSRLLRVEFHCHTIYSWDSLTWPETLVETCRAKGIDRVVVTDHNRIAGGLRAKELDPERVIVGEEIMTTKGELLCAFVQEEIPRGLEPAEAICRLREQGAFISVSHPFDRGRKGAWELADLVEITPLVDAIETFNSRCLDNRPNEQAAAYAREHHLPGTAGSDAHMPFELGRGNLLLPEFDGAESLKGVLRDGQPVTRLSPVWVHFWSTWAKVYKRTKIILGREDREPRAENREQ